MMKPVSKLGIAMGAVLLCSAAAHAGDAGDWVVRIGAHNVDPQSDNGKLANGALRVDAGSAASLTFTGERLIDPSWGIEVLAALPFEHDVKINGAKAATV